MVCTQTPYISGISPTATANGVFMLRLLIFEVMMVEVMLLMMTLLTGTWAAEARAWMKFVWTPATLFLKSSAVKLSVTTTLIILWYVHWNPAPQVQLSLEEEPAREKVLGGQGVWVVEVGHTLFAGHIKQVLAPATML